MSELTTVLAGLSEDVRRQLAHGLVLALSGVRAGRCVSAQTALVSDAVRELGASDAAAGLQSLRFQADDIQQGGSWTRPADGSMPLSERRTQELLPAGQGSPRVTVEYGAEGKTYSLRRDMAAIAGGDRETAAPGTAAAAVDPVGQLRELSEWFEQDSRRYDPGFTRY